MLLCERDILRSFYELLVKSIIAWRSLFSRIIWLPIAFKQLLINSINVLYDIIVRFYVILIIIWGSVEIF